MDPKKEPIMDISVVDNKLVNDIHNEILSLLNSAGINYYTAIGILECVKDELMMSMNYLDDEDD